MKENGSEQEMLITRVKGRGREFWGNHDRRKLSQEANQKRERKNGGE